MFMIGRGVISGVATSTEISAFAVVYALLIGGIAFRELTLESLLRVFVKSASMAGSIVFIVAAATSMSFALTLEQIPQQMAGVMLHLAHNYGSIAFMLLAVVVMIMEEALHDVPLYREFAGLGDGASRLPDETTILRFRHLLEAHDLAVDMLRVVNDILQAKGLMLRTGTAVDATLISAPSSTKNAEGERDPEMHQVKKGNQWYFGMKAHIGVDAASGLVHTVVGTAANVSDINVAGALVHGQEHAAFGDSGYQGVHKRAEAAGPTWHVAMRPGKRRLLNPFIEPEFVAEPVEKMKASIRAKVEHPFRVIKQQFGFTKVRYRGLVKNTAQIVTLFALSNLWMARKRLMQAGG